MNEIDGKAGIKQRIHQKQKYGKYHEKKIENSMQ